MICILGLGISTTEPLTAQAKWSLGPPTVSIGDADLDGDPVYQLDRVAGIVVYGGRIYVADQGSLELRAYDIGSGDFVASAGGEGQGPGEFQQLDAIESCGDSLFVSDVLANRVSVFSPDLEVLRTVRLSTHAWLTSVRCAGPGTLAATYGSVEAIPQTIGAYRMPIDIVALSSADGSPLGPSVTYPGDDRYRSTGGDSPQRWGTETLIAPLPNGFLVGPGDEWSVFRYDVQWRLRDTLSVSENRRAVTPSEIERFIDDRIATEERRGRTPDWLRSHRQFLRDTYEFPSAYPAYSVILTSSDGHVWVRRTRSYASGDLVHWKVFSPDGSLVASLDLQPGFQIRWVGTARVAGVTRNEFDVEFVELRDIRR